MLNNIFAKYITESKSIDFSEKNYGTDSFKSDKCLKVI